MSDYDKIKYFYQHGGVISLLDDGSILYAAHGVVITLDQPQSYFFGDRTLEEVMGTEDYEVMNLYIAEAWAVYTNHVWEA